MRPVQFRSSRPNFCHTQPVAEYAAPAATVSLCRRLRSSGSAGWLFLLVSLTINPSALAQPGSAIQSPGAADAKASDDDSRKLADLPAPLAKRLDRATSLNPERTIFLSADRKKVLLQTQVACTDCLLEMFCCLEQTKEHESVLWLRGKAYVVHAGLLATGSKPGQPATFSPEFRSPSGPVVEILVHWVDEAGRVQKAKAQDWMRHSVSRYYGAPLKSPPPGVKLPVMELRYDPYNKEIIWYGQMSDDQRDKLLQLWDQKDYQAAIRKFHQQSQPRPMTAEFVFGGSYEIVPEGSTKKMYAAEGGQLICVANFAAATIDVRERSSASDGGQSYEANANQVPPRGTPVLVELIPQPSRKTSDNPAAAAGPAGTEK